MAFGWRRLLQATRQQRKLLEIATATRLELQGIRLALERVADAGERMAGIRQSTFRGSLSRPSDVPIPDESSITTPDRALLLALDDLEKAMYLTSGRMPTADELFEEAQRRELV